MLTDRRATVLCENCNNCVVPQSTSAPEMCRTPSDLERRGAFQRTGACDRTSRTDDESRDASPDDTDGSA
ncbi:hypothetical protein ACFQL7_09615 [Halocatena marina]|uniref:Uncharacterized protein n=1 Tax=Halocatena marina TaxID=2934937 RepID=A0ABD5YLI6_9EURY